MVLVRAAEMPRTGGPPGTPHEAATGRGPAWGGEHPAPVGRRESRPHVRLWDTQEPPAYQVFIADSCERAPVRSARSHRWDVSHGRCPVWASVVLPTRWGGGYS